MEPTKKHSLTLQLASLLFLSFIEGGSLMGVEIISAKLIAPYFGNSIYVWSAVLATTLLGLAAGYFLGGKLSLKQNSKKTLFTISTISAVLTLALPFTSSFILESTLDFGLQLGIIIASFLIIFPIVFLFGTISPLIIQLTSNYFKKPGKTASYIYTISTLGGVLFALLTGLYLIFNFGLKQTTTVIGCILLITTLLTITLNRKNL